MSGGPLDLAGPGAAPRQRAGLQQLAVGLLVARPRRLLGMACVPLDTPEIAVAELRRAAKLPGIAGAYIPLFPSADDDYGNERWNPLWEAFLETGLPIGLHVGGRRPGTPTVDIFESAPRFMTGLIMSKFTMAEAVSELIHGLVMQRYPDLKFIAVEGQIGWISFFEYYSDHLWEKHRYWTKSELQEPPSFYFRRQVFGDLHGGPGRPSRAPPHRHRQHHVGERLPAFGDDLAQLQEPDRRMVHAVRRRGQGQDPLEELRPAVRAPVSDEEMVGGCHDWEGGRK